MIIKHFIYLYCLADVSPAGHWIAELNHHRKHLTCKPSHWWSSRRRHSRIGRFGSPGNGSGPLSAWAHAPWLHPCWGWWSHPDPSLTVLRRNRPDIYERLWGWGKFALLCLCLIHLLSEATLTFFIEGTCTNTYTYPVFLDLKHKHMFCIYWYLTSGKKIVVLVLTDSVISVIANPTWL